MSCYRQGCQRDKGKDRRSTAAAASLRCGGSCRDEIQHNKGGERTGAFSANGKDGIRDAMGIRCGTGGSNGVAKEGKVRSAAGDGVLGIPFRHGDRLKGDGRLESGRDDTVQVVDKGWVVKLLESARA